MSTSIPSEGRWTIAVVENPAGRETRISGRVQRDGGRRALHNIVELLDDAVMLLVIVLLLPLVILLFGAPVALLVRLLIEIAERM